MNDSHLLGLVGYQQAAQILGVPVGTLYTWVSLKKIPHIRMSGRLVRFDPAELRRWVEHRRVEAGNCR